MVSRRAVTPLVQFTCITDLHVTADSISYRIGGVAVHRVYAGRKASARQCHAQEVATTNGFPSLALVRKKFPNVWRPRILHRIATHGGDLVALVFLRIRELWRLCFRIPLVAYARNCQYQSSTQHTQSYPHFTSPWS